MRSSTQPEAGELDQRRGRPSGFAKLLVAVAAVLLGFLGLSSAFSWPKRGFFGQFPPMFWRWDPILGPGMLAVLLVGAGFVAAVPWLRRRRTWQGLAGLVAFAVVFAAALALQSLPRSHYPLIAHPDPGNVLAQPFNRSSEYAADIALIERLGTREYAERFPELNEAGELSLHSTTHPPGGPLLVWLLWRTAGRSLVGVAILSAFAGALTVVAVYLIALEGATRERAFSAAALAATAPGLALHLFTSLDVVFMTLVGFATAAMIRAARSRSAAFAAGLLTAVTLAFTWAGLLMIPLGLGIAWVAHRDDEIQLRALIRNAAVVAGGIVLGALVIRVALGIDLIADFAPAVGRQVGYESYRRPLGYWLVGNVVAFFLTAGIATTALVVDRVRLRWRERRPGLETVVIALLVAASLTGFYRGETDHNWLVFLPAFVACAAAERRTRAVAGVNLTQAAFVETLFYTGW